MEIQQQNETILFTNWSKERFAHPSKGGNDDHCSWDGVGFDFKPGEQKYLPGYIAKVLAKHLADRELRREQETGYVVPDDPRKDKRGVSNPVRHQQLMDYALGDLNIAETPLEAEIERLNKNINSEKAQVENPVIDEKLALQQECESKGIQYDKRWGVEKLKEVLKTPEEEFEGLNQ